ncbi:hypothetical protein Pcinc_035258 [Petrolisthes cinctipes]|uniref:Cytochrome P450 n=1 Tax=Petrolisthes cinctipes TaxID=88211 RepID=A0AAE1BX97_PETCI|nr:hypothetical protein Pcinc_035258 [Petrolisthes cinctipes]
MSEFGVAYGGSVWSSGPGFMTYLVTTILITSLLAWYIKRRRMVALVNLLPGPNGYPIIGNALDMNKDSQGIFKQLIKYTELGDVIRIWIGPVPMIILSSAKAVEALFSSRVNIDKSREYDALHPWLGTGLLNSTGSKWQSRRKMLTPAFHFKILDNFIDVFDSQACKLVEKLRGKADGHLFNIYPHFTLCALDIICETAMGRTVNAQDNENSEYVRAVTRLGEMIVERAFKAWLHNDIVYWLSGLSKEHDTHINVLHKFTRDTIKERRALYHQLKETTHIPTEEEKLLGKKKLLAFLDLLLEASDGESALTDDDIREEVDTFMFEGHDTTTVAMNWALYFLARHPDIQARVHNELDSILGDRERPVTSSDLREMKYLEMCIKESLRLLPSVPTIGRVIREELTVGDNLRVPVGGDIIIMLYKIHRDPEHFPDPEKFDPDRFLPENASKRHPFAYVPFSAGARNCIGQRFALMELKTVLARVLQQYRVESDTSFCDLQLTAQLVLRPVDGNYIRMYPRSGVE